MSGAAVGVAVATSMLADGETEIDAVDVVEVAATGEAVEAVATEVSTSMLADGETEIDAVDVVEVAATGEAVEAVATEVSSLVMRLAHLQET